MYVVDMTKLKQKPLFALNLISRRKSKGWNAERLAEEAGIAYPTLRDIEAGISGGRPKTKEAIASALDCTVDDLNQKQSSQPSNTMSDLMMIIQRQDREIDKLKSKLQETESIEVPIEMLKLIDQADDKELFLDATIKAMKSFIKGQEERKDEEKSEVKISG